MVMECLKIAAVGLHMLSIHAEPVANNNNFGVYAETQCGIIVGGFKNSFDDDTLYVGHIREFGEGRVRPFVFGALATGYDHHLLGSAGLAFDLTDHVTFRLAVVPASNPLIHTTIEWRF